ncbi:MAG TPA: response regulator [Verrucomicrobiae bacterium]|nr:response regulator [Verrucomicrobiae bacterium]
MTPIGLRQRVPAKHILLAEDDPVVAHTLRMALAVDGHSVEIAEDGGQALDMFNLGKYDLVITDFRMPNMDGMELAEAIKTRSPATPVILITAYLEMIQRTGGRVSNVDVLLGKPCSVIELYNALRRVFEPA